MNYDDNYSLENKQMFLFKSSIHDQSVIFNSKLHMILLLNLFFTSTLLPYVTS